MMVEEWQARLLEITATAKDKCSDDYISEYRKLCKQFFDDCGSVEKFAVSFYDVTDKLAQDIQDNYIKRRGNLLPLLEIR